MALGPAEQVCEAARKWARLRQPEPATSPWTTSSRFADRTRARHATIHALIDAVIAGLTLSWSSGAVEGHVDWIKMLKRQMFGRAGFNLLRKCVLLA